MDNGNYHSVRVETPAEFREQFQRLVVEEQYPRVEFEVSPSIWRGTYVEMQGRIERNNIARGRTDRIANPRTILPVAEHPRIRVRNFDDIRRNYNQRGANWIAIIPPGPELNVGENIVSYDSNPLGVHALNMGINIEFGSPHQSDNDDDDE